jgi:hypothetical protein
MTPICQPGVASPAPNPHPVILAGGWFAPSGVWRDGWAKPTAGAVGYYRALLRSFTGLADEPTALRETGEIRPNHTRSNHFYAGNSIITG